jgi:DNA-binding SARP family transcriptional activator/TolB-like protein
MTVSSAPGEEGRPAYIARLFGSFSIADRDGHPLTPPSRKARGVLAYLLLSNGQSVTRERLAAALWGDRGEEQARASLRQSLYELRSFSQGAAPLIETDRTTVRIRPAQVGSDLDQLRASRDSGDAGTLLALLGDRPAPLLDDLDDLDPGFDDWLALERVRRGEERLAIAIAVARRVLSEGDATGAADIAERVLAAEPCDEAATRLAMEAYGRRGDRDGVRKVFARHAAALQRHLDVASPAEMLAFRDQVLADAHPVAPPAISPRAPVSPHPDDGPAAAAARDGSPARSRHRRLAIGCVAAGALFAGAGLYGWMGQAKAGQTMIVEPLQAAAGDAPAEALGNGLASDVARMIVGTAGQLDVIDQATTSLFGRSADYVVASDAQTSGGQVHASIRLLDRRSGAILWSRSFVRTAGEVDALRDQMSAHVADIASCGLSDPKHGLADLGADTMRLYLEACEEKHGDWLLDARLLAQIVQRRPDFAHAWAMLGAATISYAGELGNPPDSLMRKGAAYSRRALALDPSDSEAYVGLADSLQGRAQWPERWRLIQKGLALDPDNAILNIESSFELFDIGRVKEGAVYAQRGVQNDPFNRWGLLSLMAYTAYGDPSDDVGDQLATAHRFWPEDSNFDGAAFRIAARRGDPARALAMIDEPGIVSDDDAGRQAWRAFLHARIDKTAASRATAVGLLRDDLRSTSDTGPLMRDAANLTVLGETDLAFEALDRIGDRQVDTALYFYNYMAPLRADPRFMRFARRQGLVALWQRTNLWPDFCRQPGLPYDCKRFAAPPPGSSPSI